MSNKEFTLYSGGLKGSEETFGACAEKHGLSEVNFSFAGHKIAREKNVTILRDDELAKGDISMEIVSARMGRSYAKAETIRKVFQVIFHQVYNARQVFAAGWIQPDKTVVGGTGWGIELAKFFGREVNVFDLESNKWFTWKSYDWTESTPVISEKAFCGTGTRNLSDAGKTAIEELFARSFC